MVDKNYVYYVEGQCEEKLLKVLKTDMRLIQPGKIIKRNVIQDKLRHAQLTTLKKGTTANRPAALKAILSEPLI